MKQPALGIVSSVTVMALSLVFISAFTVPALTTWITFWFAIIWGGWPFGTLIKNPVAALGFGKLNKTQDRDSHRAAIASG